jgi:recombination protein RecR
MLEQLPTLAQLIRTLQQIPYVASKNIYKVAAHFVHMTPAQIDTFCAQLTRVKEQLQECDHCFCLKEKEKGCVFCTAKKRHQTTVCVVETWEDVFSIEKTGGYQGVYHVLGGVIYPLEGVGPEDLRIDELVKRVLAGSVQEVILATNQTPEGEATAAFIARRLKELDIMISCLARGLPVGASLGTMDRLTVFKALSERRPF